MYSGGVTGLPFQNDPTIIQKANQQSNATKVFSGKDSQSKVIAQKILDVNQAFQQKGSIFQTENHKTNIAENGYVGKLVDQKWAQANHNYEQTNVKRLNNASQSLENAVIKTGINLKSYESKIKTTNTEISDLDNKINTNTKEIENMSKIFATEEQSKSSADYAKRSLDYSVNKDNSLNKELKSLESTKDSSSANVENIKQNKSDISISISSLTTQKSSISQKINSNVSKKSSFKSDINSLNSSIDALKAKKGSGNAQNKTVQTGNSTVAAATNTNIAIDTTQTVQQNNGAAAVIAETLNINTIETGNSVQASEQNVQDESTQASIDAQIDAQILSLENALTAKIAEQDQLDKDIESLTKQEIQIAAQIKAKQNEDAKLAVQQENEENKIPGLEQKILAKQANVDENKKITEEKEDIYKKASGTHSADLQKREAIEAKYKATVAQTNEMKQKRNNSDQGLKKLHGVKEYFNALLEGQGNAKVGAKANLEDAAKKETKEYSNLKIKNNLVKTSRLSLFSQKDSEFKAKGDLNSVKTEIDSYSNVFSSMTKTKAS